MQSSTITKETARDIFELIESSNADYSMIRAGASESGKEGSATQASSQWLIQQYELQHSMQNATKNYVCAPLQSIEATYVEQLRKMSRRDDVLREVPIATTNRFDVSKQMKLNDEETNTLDELVKAFRTRKLERVAVLRKNQTVCEESLRSQCRYIFRWMKVYMVSKLQDTLAELSFAFEQLRLYSN